VQRPARAMDGAVASARDHQLGPYSAAQTTPPLPHNADFVRFGEEHTPRRARRHSALAS
jgi:hypothetical protein